MKSFSFYAAYIVKKLWTLAAVLLVVVAVSISLLRYTLPHMDKQKTRVEQWLSEQYGVELAIGELSAGWSGIGPTLVLRDIVLKQNERSPLALDIDETQVELDFWGTVLARQINSRRFELSGLHLTVNLAQIRGAESDFPIVEALESLFLEQLQQFSVRDSIVEIQTFRDRQLIDIQRLSWVNRGSKHQGVGELRVVELTSNSAYFGLDLNGDKDNLSGTFYAKGEELDLTPWLNQFVKTEYEVKESRGNFVFWANIDQSQVTEVQIELNESQFAWQTPESEVQASIVGGSFNAVPRNEGWDVNIDNLALRSEDKSLITSWAARLERNGDTLINSRSPMNVEPLLPLMALVFDPKTHQLLNELSPEATVDELQMAFNGSASVLATFSDLSWQQSDLLPGLKDLKGQFSWHDTRGTLDVVAADSVLEIDNILDENIDFSSLSLQVQIESDEQGYDIRVPQLRFVSEVVEIDQSMMYRSEDSFLAIIADIAPLDVTEVKTLFPTTLMGKDTRSYLNRALVSGDIQRAKLLWAGEPSQFPFEQNQGIFQAAVNISDAEFSFHEDWPTLTDFDINLLFENESLTMRSEKGSLQDVQLKNLKAVIPSLEAGAILTIDAIGQAEGHQVTELMLASNLADSIGAVLDTGVQVSGDVITNLNLHIPLSDPDVIATGEVTLADNGIYLPDLDISYEHASGVVSFVNDKVSFTGVQADLLQQPVELNFDGFLNADQDYQINVNVSGNWDVLPLLETYHPGFSPFVEGSGAWTADVDATLGESEFDYKLMLKTDLKGLASTLPAPFAKETNQMFPFSLTSQGNKQASNVSAILGNEVKFVGVLPHKEFQFSRAHLAIGRSEFVGMGLGFSISADMEDVDFAQWYGAISALVSHIPSNDKPLIPAPQRIYVDVDTLHLLGQSIENLQLVAKHTDKDWQLDFNAEQARAKVNLDYDWYNKGIEVEADYINLSEWQGDETQQTYQPELSSLPPISFKCKQCRYHGKDLGAIDLALSRTQGGMHVDRLSMQNDHGRIRATGDWYISDNGSSTRLIGDMESSDFGALLKGFDINSGIKDSKGSFKFDLSWQHAPYDFNLATLNGDLDWRLTDGYLSEVSDKGSRIFSILSLQSLVRKLSLDFRDVFAKGFFYDKMRGSFQVNDGRVDTRDTVIDGGAGEMTIAGYTDLNSQQLNYDISFAPNVTSSLPLLVYWMVNPATAIAALAIDQVLTEAKVISNVRYSLTGTIDEPIFTEMGRKSKDISLPAKATPPKAPVQGASSPESLPVIDQRVSIGVDNG